MSTLKPIPASSGAETINLTPEGWQLFTTMRGVKAVAARLNQAFNSSTDETAMRTAVHQVMIKTCDFGSFDSEPREVLEVLLAQRFRGFDPDDYNGPALRFADGLACGCADCDSGCGICGNSLFIGEDVGGCIINDETNEALNLCYWCMKAEHPEMYA